jgi:hypothetical protein
MNKDLRYAGDVADGTAQKDSAQDRSGIYQDRVNGKLPMDRVAGHYQSRDAQLNQDALQSMKNVATGFKYGAGQFTNALGDLYDAGKDMVKGSTLGKIGGAVVDHLSGTKKAQANEHQTKYLEKRDEILGKK